VMSGLLAWSFLGTRAKHVNIKRRSVMGPWKALTQAVVASLLCFSSIVSPFSCSFNLPHSLLT
jgi:predicted Na+-dependent transporter